MNPRIPLAAAVVGALVIGGATTAGTSASWVGQAGLASSGVSSGQLSYTASNPGAVTVEKVTGSSADSTFTIADTSLGKNIAQRTTASIGSVPAGLSATIGATCPGPTTSVSVDTTPASGPRTLCVRVTVTNASTAASGNVVVNLGSAQRPAAGWTTVPIQRSVAVTVTPPAPPSAPTLACDSFTNNGNYTLTWASVSGLTYSVYRSSTTNSDGAYTLVPTPPAHTSPYAADMPEGTVRFWRVRATNSAGAWVWSNTVRLTRTGNGINNHKCEPLS